MASDNQTNIGQIEIGSAEDLSIKAFESYSKSNFKETTKLLEQLKKPGSEKDSRIQLNCLITEYYENKGRNPQKFLNDMINLSQDMTSITRAPACQIKQTQDGTQQQMIHLGNIYQFPLNHLSINQPEFPNQMSGSTSHRSASSSQKYNQIGQGEPLMTTQLGQGEVNSVLLYNIAAMSYQTQQYGKSISYLIEIFKNLEQVEEFLIIKSMFLMLQVLFELRQPTSAWPIITFLEIKLKEFQQVIQQKQNIKAQTNDGKQLESQEELKVPDINETLDETILNKNSFSIINASYLRKHAVSPKNMNILEYKILLQSYKSIFHLLNSEVQQAHTEIKLAGELKSKFNQDPVKIKHQVNLPAQVQLQGMINNLKSLVHLSQGNIVKSIQNLSNDEKEIPTPHPSCHHAKQQDEQSKVDQVYQRCISTHPHYYFNNLGIVHMKLQKYSMAIFYFSKAMKFLEKSQTGQAQWTNEKENYNDYISHLSSQKTSEILYNYGIALYKIGKFEEAFKCFEKASSCLKHHTRLWYYMGLSILNFNLQKQQEHLREDYQSDVFYKMLSFGEPQYTKILNKLQHKRFLLTEQGDPIQNLAKLVSEYETKQQDKLKQQQQELSKQQQNIQGQKQTKAQQKKDKNQQANKPTTTLPPDSMSLQSAIMYLQNALVSIEVAKQNEINYAMYTKFILRQQIINSQASQDSRNIAGLSQQNQSHSDSLNESTDTQSIQGSEENSLIYDFPQNQNELSTIKQSITEKIDKKFENLKKNVHIHLCYLFLMTYDYSNAIKTGNLILRNLNPSPKTRFLVLQYLAEAYCMIGQTNQALDCLKIENLVDADAKFKVDNLANGMRDNQPINAKTIQTINNSAVLICAGQLDQAKASFDQVLEALELKLQTTEQESKNLIPSYLVNLLVYFYIKTKNFGMARQLLKSRRFVVDTNHIEPTHQSMISAAQRARNKSKTLIKNFT